MSVLEQKNSLTGGKCQNSAGHLVHNTNLELHYFLQLRQRVYLYGAPSLGDRFIRMSKISQCFIVFHLFGCLYGLSSHTISPNLIFSTLFHYHTLVIISCSLYILNPLFDGQKLFLKDFFFRKFCLFVLLVFKSPRCLGKFYYVH